MGSCFTRVGDVPEWAMYQSGRCTRVGGRCTRVGGRCTRVGGVPSRPTYLFTFSYLRLGYQPLGIEW